jgi:hypothetical protein
MLHKVAIASILGAIVCFLLVPILGVALIVVGLAIETFGYIVWGSQFWRSSKSNQATTENERS